MKRTLPIGTRLMTKQRNCLGAVLPLGTTGTVVFIEDGIHTIHWDGYSIRSHWLLTDILTLSTYSEPGGKGYGNRDSN